MNEPNELSPEARALLTEAAGGDDPSPADRARVRRTLMATLAGGAGLAASSAASSAAASATAAGTVATGATLSLSAKIAAVVLVVGAVSGTVAVAPWEAPDPPARSEAARLEPARHERTAGERVSPSVAEAAPAPAIEEPVIEEPLIEEPVIDEPRAAMPQRAARPSAPARSRSSQAAIAARVVEEPAPQQAIEPAAPPSASTLADEMRILRSAQSALSAGDPDAALARLAEHARRFPSGVMAEEREAARIVALCRAGRRDDARTAAASFLRERPTSPLAARVRASCE